MNVGGDINDHGTTPKLKISNLADIAKQIVYICVSVPVESHAGRILGLVGQMVSRILGSTLQPERCPIQKSHNTWDECTN